MQQRLLNRIDMMYMSCGVVAMSPCHIVPCSGAAASWSRALSSSSGATTSPLLVFVASCRHMCLVLCVDVAMLQSTHIRRGAG